MKTSARNEQSAERGVTLLEMLITLTIVLLSVGVVGAGVSARAPQLVVDRAADALVVDLKRARLAAQTSGAPVIVSAGARGYEIPTLSIDRAFPEGLAARWNGEEKFQILIGSGLDQQAAAIVLRKGRAQSRVEVAPVSGRIRRER